MNKTDYLDKVDSILSDTTKFQKIRKNPIEELKEKANNLIKAANKTMTSKLEMVIGDYKPGYFYGNVKTHKDGNPLRPIISQIPLPTYELAKTLNRIIYPYVPAESTLKSSSEFVDLLKSQGKRGILASLDATSLFTNVPVEKTIDILSRYAYETDGMAPPEMPRHLMKSLLRLCTKKAPFISPRGEMFLQIDGVAMGSPLGVLFAQAYMTAVEEEVLRDSKPYMYARYVDDIYVDVQSESELNDLKTRLEEASGLNFTCEIGGDKINFLDVSINATDGNLTTDVYRKPTDPGKCLHGQSECPQRYKESVIRAYVHRAVKHCSNWAAIDCEIKRIKQVLVNNSYPISFVDTTISKVMDKYINRDQMASPGTTHVLYYRNQMSAGYKADEKALRSIVRRNCRPVQSCDSIDLRIYYTSPKTSSLIMVNNFTRDKTPLKQTNVVYQYKCPLGDCALLPDKTYIGKTSTTLTRRLTYHKQQGGPRHHTENEHDTQLTRDILVKNTKIIAYARDKRRLAIMEAVHIRNSKPALNGQMTSKAMLTLFEGPRLQE